MFESLFGSEMPLAARFFIAFLVVLALIGVTAWLVRRFGANRLGSTARGRQPRLAVIDAATVDGRRRLVLIRRDNIEHLLMIGGPTDLVVEPNIVRAVGAREVAREPARTGAPAEPAARPSPAVENGWPWQPAGEPAPTHPPRSYRPAATDEPWIAPEPTARPRPADITGIANELSNRLNNPDTPPVVRNEPPPRSPAPLSEPASTQADHNLAEMAQQLEAALRRSPAPEGRPPVTDPLAGHLPGAPAKGSDPGARAPLRDHKPRVEPKFEPKAEPKFEPRSEPKFDSKLEPREPAPTPGKNLYENLEEEMASLLGRPPGKS
jgi:flagellar protein FliO/FliZ